MRRVSISPIYTAVFLLVAVAFIQTATAQSVDKDWAGSYEFFDGQTSGPKNRQSDFITYTLIISQKDNALTARFTADGTQTSDEYECSVQASANSIKVFFEKDLGGTEVDKFKPLKKGDLLFTLTKIKNRRKTKYLFKAGDYKIDLLSARAGTPIYFRKTK